MRRGLPPIPSTALVVATALLAAPATAQAEEGVGGGSWFPGTLSFAIVLTIAHLAAPGIRRLLKGRETAVESFGGGMAVAYVFVHLLPELDKGHALLGQMIFVVALFGFILYFGIEKALHLYHVSRPKEEERGFHLRLAHLWVYNWLLVYGTPAAIAESGWRVTPVVVAIALHLVHSDYSFGTEYPKRFDRLGRYLLALAPLAGWLTALLEQKTNEAVNDFFVALLAGTLLYKVFKQELPEHEESRFGWFLCGVFGFVTFVMLSLD